MIDQDETQPTSDYDEEEEEGIPKTLRKRGPNAPKWGLDGPQLMEFNALGQPVGTDTGRLCKYVAHVARDHALLPLDIKKWGDMDATRLLLAWNRVKDTISWTQEQSNDKVLMKAIEGVVLSKLNDRWKTNKIYLRNKFYTPRRGLASRFKSPDPMIESSVWKRLVYHWDSTEYAALQDINRKNASIPRMHHTTGTQSFGQVEHIHEKKTGKKVDRYTKLKICYTRNDGTIVDNHAKKATDAIENELTKMPVETQGTLEARNSAYESVLGGHDRHGRALGYGLGVRSGDVFTSKRLSIKNARTIEAVRQELAEKYEKEYLERLASAQTEIEKNITKKVEEQVTKRLEEEQAKRDIQFEERMRQFPPEPAWLTKMIATDYSS